MIKTKAELIAGMPAAYENLEQYLRVCRINLKIAISLKASEKKSRWVKQYSELVNNLELVLKEES